jgi:hypothetical protein
MTNETHETPADMLCLDEFEHTSCERKSCKLSYQSFGCEKETSFRTSCRMCMSDILLQLNILTNVSIKSVILAQGMQS